MRLLVFGGRNFDDLLALRRALDAVHAKRAITVMIVGRAPGADTLAEQWALARNITVEPYTADWRTLGRKAGPIRNQRMIDEGKPDGAVAFPGGAGTADMKRRCEAAGVRVWEPNSRRG